MPWFKTTLLQLKMEIPWNRKLITHIWTCGTQSRRRVFGAHLTDRLRPPALLYSCWHSVVARHPILSDTHTHTHTHTHREAQDSASQAGLTRWLTAETCRLTTQSSQVRLFYLFFLTWDANKLVRTGAGWIQPRIWRSYEKMNWAEVSRICYCVSIHLLKTVF